MEKPCHFCKFYREKGEYIIAESESFFSIFDDFPVNPGRAPIISKRQTLFFLILKNQNFRTCLSCWSK